MKCNIKNIGFIIFVLAACLSHSIVADGRVDIIYLLFFSVAMLSLYLIKNRYASYLAGAVVLIALAVYCVDYAFFTVPVFLLTIVYRSAMNKISASEGKNKHRMATENVWLQLIIMLGVAEGIYSVVLLTNNQYNIYFKDFKSGSVIFLLLAVIFIAGSFSKALKSSTAKFYKVSKQDYSTLSLFNFVSLFMFAGTVLYSCAKFEELQVSSTRIYFPWAVWLCAFIFEKNPMTEAMLVLLEEKIKKVSDRMDKEI